MYFVHGSSFADSDPDLMSKERQTSYVQQYQQTVEQQQTYTHKVTHNSLTLCENLNTKEA